MRLFGLGPQSTSSCGDIPVARLGMEAKTTLGPGGNPQSLSLLWQIRTCLEQNLASVDSEELGILQEEETHNKEQPC